MSVKTRKYAVLAALMGFAAPLLGACSGNIIEAPYYETTNVAGFRSYAAPSNIMVMEVHDGQTGIDNARWASLLSNHGFAPQLQFVTPEKAKAEMAGAHTDTRKDHPTLRPDQRLVVVVNPTQDTWRNEMCQNPQNTPLTPGEKTIPVRFAFCSGDSVVSEIRANMTNPINPQQVDDMASTIIHYLFPINQPDRNENRCNRFAPC
ncbi:hypothetical protein TH25_13765 [Thalassospira profundimaris]|uniref:DUF4136 domain-containing protein n=1 Tax=Thalassospira profundimaris TaxID=502049 RepID=A0A367X4T4_9PROT|nr:hypothetical protein [Thalassospira profundimaris]RCK48674.1 hypothetical protein TH25_13765 [Thalassospira profundimaris]